MKRPDPHSRAAAQAQVLDAHEIAERKNFLEFTQADSDRLGRLHNQLEPVGYAFAESFYDHLLEFAPLRHLLPDEHTLDRLRRSQSEPPRVLRRLQSLRRWSPYEEIREVFPRSPRTRRTPG